MIKNELKAEQESLNSQIANGINTSNGVQLNPEAMEQLKTVKPELYKTIMNRLGQVTEGVDNNTTKSKSELPIPVHVDNTTPSASVTIIRNDGKVINMSNKNKIVKKEKKRVRFADIKAALLVILYQLYRESNRPEERRDIKDIIIELNSLYPNTSKGISSGNIKKNGPMNRIDAVGVLLKQGYTKSQIDSLMKRGMK